jgi:glutathione peroxidase
MKVFLTFVPVVLCVALVAAQEKAAQPAVGKPATAPASVTATTATSPLDFTMPEIDGKDVPLSRYKGDVLLIVNVASKCGFTPQYKPLEEVYQKYKARGFRIAAFPANNFKQQEPGTAAEIKEFCSKNYGVTFDLFAKVSVKGDDQCELYKFLTSKDKTGDSGGEIPWNFTKFLVARDGKVLARFDPKVKPDDAEVIKAIEQALEAKKKAEEPQKP